jgi:hypothetical protein
VVAAVASYFAGLDDEAAAGLAAHTASRSGARVAADVATAVVHLQTAGTQARDAAFAEARNLILQSHRRETLRLASLRRFGARRALELSNWALQRLEGQLGSDLETLERAYRALTGNNPPNPVLPSEARAMMQKVFVPATDPGTWYDALREVKSVAGLHSMMRFEALNFCDGRRNAWQVYEAVSAEALAAGAWYYGSVKPADVLEWLERVAKAGALTVKAGR